MVCYRYSKALGKSSLMSEFSEMIFFRSLGFALSKDLTRVI